ncbi:molybdate ABC transporter substrate-binding protein [Lentibacter sp.]|uniref:molybdate ABC transporter substrate-binding protein n=1 Tax=Lentibacter sp. TaxID=2024994 RepID=UPI003F6A80EF
MLWFGRSVLALWFAVMLGNAALADRVSIFAAASLKTALDEIAPLIEAETGHELRLVYAGSSTLARQIEQGAPADLFISANVAWMDHLQINGKVDASNRVDLLSNELVLISRLPAPDLRLGDASSFGPGRIAMGLVSAVPAGIYGREALETLGLWGALQSQVVQTDNVRAALALVARGEARFGLVYASDAVAEPKVQVVLQLPSDTHSPIIYPVGRLSPSEAAADVLASLQGAAAQRVFEAQGFGLLGVRPAQ